MKVFELIEQEPTITPEALLIKPFKEIWDRDKSKHKEKALQELAYVYFMTDYKSFYLGYPEKDREDAIIEQVIDIKKWKPDSLIKEACKTYDELQVTPSLRFLQSQIGALEKMEGYFNSIDWDEETSKGQPKYKITDVSRACKDAGSIISSLEKLEEKVKKEQATNESKVRGGGKPGEFEMGH